MEVQLAVSVRTERGQLTSRFTAEHEWRLISVNSLMILGMENLRSSIVTSLYNLSDRITNALTPALIITSRTVAGSHEHPKLCHKNPTPSPDVRKPVDVVSIYREAIRKHPRVWLNQRMKYPQWSRLWFPSRPQAFRVDFATIRSGRPDRSDLSMAA
jgi:hypothetical protein